MSRLKKLVASIMRTKPPFYHGYWQTAPEKTDEPSLARYGSPQKTYVFYRLHHGRFQQKHIPAWFLTDFNSAGSGEVNNANYFSLANAVLAHHHTLPSIKAEIKDNLVSVFLSYLLPVAEANFFHLYSWPLDYKQLSKFQRQMALDVYPTFKQHLNSLGYKFEEKIYE